MTTEEFTPEDINRPAHGPKWLGGFVVIIVLLALAAGGMVFYTQVIKPQQSAKTDQRPEGVVNSHAVEVPNFSAFDMEPPMEEAEYEQPNDVYVPTTDTTPSVVYIERKPPDIDWSASSTTIESVTASSNSNTSNGVQVASNSGTGGALTAGNAPTGNVSAGLGVAIQRDDLDTRMNRGTFISGNMQTRLDTTFSGQGVCIIDKPVYSANGKRMLLDSGDVMLGTYDSGMITPGVKRIAMIWDMLKANNGATEVPMNTPGTDTLGTTGMGARIDTKFWARWNEVLMASFFDVAIAEASRGSSNNSGEQIVIGMANATSSLAQEVFKSRADIKPIAYDPQGTKCGTTLTHDLDFSGVKHGRG